MKIKTRILENLFYMLSLILILTSIKDSLNDLEYWLFIIGFLFFKISCNFSDVGTIEEYKKGKL